MPRKTAKPKVLYLPLIDGMPAVMSDGQLCFSHTNSRSTRHPAQLYTTREGVEVAIAATKRHRKQLGFDADDSKYGWVGVTLPTWP